MGTNTVIKDHWILDREYSDDAIQNYENQVILDTINSKISERTNALIESNTLFDDKIEKDSFYVPNIFTKSYPKYKNYISKSQKWIGHVTEISNDEFTAKLVDKNDTSSTYEIAQFDIDEVSKGDIDLLKVGALFYWSVGYANQNGQIIKQSLIRFKRVADISIEDFDGIIDNARELSNSIIWD